jgi:microcystin degradation protein MlrC
MKLQVLYQIAALRANEPPSLCHTNARIKKGVQNIRSEINRLIYKRTKNHDRADYGKIAKAMYTLALPGVASPDPKSYQYKNWKGKV